MATNQIRVVVNDLERFLDRVIRKLVLDIVANLRSAPSSGFGTPVDTGWARANWVPRVGSPPTGTVGTREQAENGVINASAAEVELARIATTYSFRQGRVYITNNVPYITRLNEGYSRQAPRGFVQKAIAKAVTVDLGARLL
jgi:hypothetical protein